MPKSNYRYGRFHNTFRPPPGYVAPCQSGMKRDFIFNSNDARQGHCIAYKEARDIPTQVETEDYYIWRNRGPQTIPHPEAPKVGHGIALIGAGSALTFIFLIVTIMTILTGPGFIAIVPGLITVGCILMIVFGVLMMQDANKESSDKNAEIDAINAKNNSDYAAEKPTESYEIYIAPPTLTTLATPTSPTI